MSYDIDLFLKIYPEFSELPKEAIEYELSLADRILSDYSWGEYRNDALFLRAAHYLGVRFNIGLALKNQGKNGINSGMATSMSASNATLSQTNALNAFVQSDNPIWADFGRTTFGLGYLSLLAQVMEYGQVIKSPGIGYVYRNHY